MSSKHVYIVPHSHWDREWYFTIEDSNIILAENMTHLLEVLQHDEEYKAFVFDGQVSILDEYLKVAPEKEAVIKNLVASKRLFVGPWYTQADSLLVHKESLVRNLLYGINIAESFGHSMNIGYLPDIFGQNMYLPSVFAQFGIDYSILQRGVYTDELDEDVHFVWQAPDEGSVKSTLLPIGYGPGKFLEASEAYREETLYPLIEKIAKLSKSTDHILFPSGGDQVLIRKHFPDTIKELNQLNDGNTYVLSDYETYMEETWDDGLFQNVIQGELVGTELSRIHRTIGSQRYDIKYWNYHVEHKLINQLEPLYVLGEQLGLNYPKLQLDHIWKELFDVHSHDSIGGCNSDETNQAIIERLKTLNRKVDGLLNVVKKQITQGIVQSDQDQNILTVFNAAAKEVSQPVEAVIFTKEKEFQLETSTDENLDYALLKQEHVDGGKKIQVMENGEKQIPLPGYYRNELLIAPLKVPALGYTTLHIKESKQALKPRVSEKLNEIENEQLKIYVENDALVLENKETGAKTTNFVTFEDTADAGDSYDYSPLLGDTPILMDKVEWVDGNNIDGVQELVVKHSGNIPVNLEERAAAHPETEGLEIYTILTLRPGEAFIRLQHQLSNQLYDHRVRVLLDASITDAEYSYGDQGYSLIERPIEDERLTDWQEKGLREAPVPIYTIERFAGVAGGDQALTAITKGLKEYEVLSDSKQLAITLYRSVGLLGRDDLAWRPGRASGINNKMVETPDAQMIGELSFEYAVVLGKKKEAELFALADQYQGQLLTYQNQKLNTIEERLDRFEIPTPLKNLPTSESLFTIYNEEIFISSIKKAEQDEGTIIRLYNPTTTTVQVELTSDWYNYWEQVNLKEERSDQAGGPLEIPAKSFRTLRLTRKDANDD